MIQRYMRVVFVALPILFGGLAWAQHGQPFPPPRSGQVRGKIRMPDGRPAQAGALVYLESSGGFAALGLNQSTGGVVAQTQTDSGGKFEFPQIAAGIYLVRVRMEGYKEITATADITSIPSAWLNLDLQPDPNYKGPLSPSAPGGMISAESLNAPEGARRDLEKGKELLSKGTDVGKSIQLFKKAVAAYPSYSEAYLLMGVAYGRQNRWSDASTALNRAIEINPKYTAAYLTLGAFDNQQNKFADAEKPLVKAIDLNSDSADAQLELARAYWGLGRWQDADPHAAKAVELRPENADGHLILGNILLRKRDGPGALREYKESLRLAPNGPLSEPIRQMVAKLEAALNGSQEKAAK